MTKSNRNPRFHLYLMMAAAFAMLLTGSLALHADGKDAAKKQGTFAAEFTPIWQNARAYSLKFAGAIPPEHYSFKPTPEIMSFGEQVVHTASATFWFASKITGEANPGKGFKAVGKSKAEIVAFLEKSFDYVEKALAGLNDKDAAEKIHLFGELSLTKAQTLMTIRDHITHHRGQMVIYLRLKGIKPPEYVGW